MKKKSTSQSAFFNLRVLIGLFVALTGVSLIALGGLATTVKPVRLSVGASSHSRTPQSQQNYKVITQGQYISPLVPAAFDCSKIHQLGIDRMENLRAGAIMIFCGEAKGGEPDDLDGSTFSKLAHKVMAPVNFGGTDVDLITGTENFPNVTQSETYSTVNPDDPSQIVVAFNDSRGINANPFNLSGASVSIDGGTTFTRLTQANGQSPFANTAGDPVILYNKPSGKWLTVWIADGQCSGGLGGYSSTTPWDPDSWTTHYCVDSSGGGGDDRESGWADNDPSSPFFGRLYVSWNNFSVGTGALSVTFSTDNGATWHSPVIVSNAGFIRNTQITGDMSGNGIIYIAGMDEGGGGFPHNDTNLIFKSTDGGATWANTYTGTPFAAPGVVVCSDNPYFTCMFPDQGGFW